MDREGDSPTPAEHTPAEDETRAETHDPTDPVGHSGSRWEPRDDTGAPPEGSDPPAAGPHESAGVPMSSAGSTWWHEGPTTSAAAPRRRRRGVRVAAGLGAPLPLAGGGFAAGPAVGASGPDGGPDGGPGVGRRHHGDGD